MLKDYVCEECGHRQQVWRQLSKNMPESVECKVWFGHDPPYNFSGQGHNCLGRCYPDDRIQAPGVVFKGSGWTPNSSAPVLDLGDDGE